MIRQVIFRPEAGRRRGQDCSLVEERSPGLGEELIDEILLAAERAGQNPDLFRIIRAEGEVRGILTGRFPYRIFFSVLGETLFVHAILHGAQHDRRWHERM